MSYLPLSGTCDDEIRNQGRGRQTSRPDNNSGTMSGLRTIDGGRSDTVEFTSDAIAILVDACSLWNSDRFGTNVKGRFR